MCRFVLICIYSAGRTGLEMFPVSSQKKYWTFVDETDLIRLRNEANRKFILKHGANMTVSAGRCNRQAFASCSNVSCHKMTGFINRYYNINTIKYIVPSYHILFLGVTQDNTSYFVDMFS